MKRSFLLFLITCNLIASEPTFEAEMQEAISLSEINLKINYCLISCVRELLNTPTMKYQDIKPIIDFVINKLFEEKDLWLLTYFHCEVDNENIKKDISNKMEHLKTDIRNALKGDN